MWSVLLYLLFVTQLADDGSLHEYYAGVFRSSAACWKAKGYVEREPDIVSAQCRTVPVLPEGR